MPSLLFHLLLPASTNFEVFSLFFLQGDTIPKFFDVAFLHSIFSRDHTSLTVYIIILIGSQPFIVLMFTKKRLTVQKFLWITHIKILYQSDPSKYSWEFFLITGKTDWSIVSLLLSMLLISRSILRELVFLPYVHVINYCFPLFRFLASSFRSHIFFSQIIKELRSSSIPFIPSSVPQWRHAEGNLFFRICLIQ